MQVCTGMTEWLPDACLCTALLETVAEFSLFLLKKQGQFTPDFHSDGFLAPGKGLLTEVGANWYKNSDSAFIVRAKQ
jgi:hypothetical protein